MLTREEKRTFREEIFRHLDGIVTAPVAWSLFHKGVMAHLDASGSDTLEELSRRFGANPGYLHVALRVLCSQGWLAQSIAADESEIRFHMTGDGRLALDVIPWYEGVVDLLAYSGQFHPRRFEQRPFEKLRALFGKHLPELQNLPDRDTPAGRIRYQVLKHIEGVLVGPTIVHLGMGGMFHKYFMEASFRPEEFHHHPESFRELLGFFAELGWFVQRNGTFRFTEKGFFFAQRASAYGVTVSYLPLFREMEELLFGNPHVLRDTGPGEPERHVDREMNVWGSGGAHAAYFRKVDDILIELFNRPIGEQPKGILDMGCGNGAFLRHVFEVIEQRTLRGQMLDEHPLFLVGADYNEAALRVTRANLIQADIWAKVVWGDIGRPDLLAADLADAYGIDLRDLLNVRTFLDHNRIWAEPEQPTPGRTSTSSGAFAHRGRRIPNHLVEDSLREHLRRWAPYVDRFGLLVIELHTIAPELAAAHLGRTAATAYDATHGFSDQYIVEIGVFQRMAQEAGLVPDPAHFARFPDSDLATISIHLLRGG